MMRVLIAAPVKQDVDIFKEYIASLNRLKIPKDVTADKCFYLHDCPELIAYTGDAELIFNDLTVEFATNGKTHEWKDKNLEQVRYMKNALLMKAEKEGYDYIFFVDSDLILHPETLEVLLSRGKDIVAEVFWTEWEEGSNIKGPNAWECDFISCDPKKYMVPGCHKVGGTGACILISRKVIEAGVSYEPIPNVSFSAWEDRAFCIRAQVHGFDIYLDTTRTARHLYRRSEYEKYMRRKAK